MNDYTTDSTIPNNRRRSSLSISSIHEKKSSMLNESRRTSLASSESESRKGQPVYTGVVKYFPDALKYVSKVSKKGNDQHHSDKPLHWDKNKSTDNEDALVRHLIDHSQDPVDDDGLLHLGKVAWRALAALQIHLENDKRNTKGEVEG